MLLTGLCNSEICICPVDSLFVCLLIYIYSIICIHMADIRLFSTYGLGFPRLLFGRRSHSDDINICVTWSSEELLHSKSNMRKQRISALFGESGCFPVFFLRTLFCSVIVCFRSRFRGSVNNLIESGKEMQL